MTISSFDDLLTAAGQQPEPQRLLLVFASAELPPDSTAQQREDFLAGRGGALVPMMCVDKSPGELLSFATLLEESQQFGQKWDMVFAAALAGRAGVEPSAEVVEKALQRMVEAIKAGTLGTLIPFDRQGQAIRLG